MITAARRIPISARLALLFALVVLATVLVLGALVHEQLGRTLRNRIDQGLLEDAREAGARLLGPGAAAGDLRGREVLRFPAVDRRLLVQRSIEFEVQLLGRGGQVLAASGTRLADEPLVTIDQVEPARPSRDSLRTVELDGRRWRVLPVPVSGDRVVSAVIFASSLDDVGTAQRALLTSLLPLGAIAVLAAGAGGYFVARRGLLPIDRMVAEANAINASDLRRRLPVPEGDDEVARLGLTLNAMLERLQAAIERERAFTADASHELRSPLAILRGELELTRAATRDPRVEESLRSALEEADRLAALIDDLLVLARADASELEMHTEVDLAALAASAAERFAVLSGERNVRIETHGGAAVRGDSRSLERAISNLLDNAVRHSPPGGVVELSVERGTGGVLVSVRDQGPGLAVETLPSLFERFTRGDASRPRGGAGLGLAIVAATARAHGGDVRAANRATGGLEVTMELPGADPRRRSPTGDTPTAGHARGRSAEDSRLSDA